MSTADEGVTVIIPSRNERFLHETVRDVLGQARGPITAIVALDGYWTRPDQPHLPSDPRLHLLHRGDAVGMRDNINAAAAIAKTKFIMKLDGHCKLAEGYDVALSEACDGDWVMAPRRYALDPERWEFDTENPKYPIDYHYLSYPWERPTDPECGLHGTPWGRRREERKHITGVDDEASSQGSCWFMHRAWFNHIGPMDQSLHGPFISEHQEVGMKTVLAGGLVKVHKGTYYAHLRKGRKWGRGYALGPNQFGQSDAVTDYYMNDRWPGKIAGRSMRWWVERFHPMPGWPLDLDVAFAEARARAKS